LLGGADEIADPDAEQCRRIRTVDPDVRQLTRLFVPRGEKPPTGLCHSARCIRAEIFCSALDKDTHGGADQFPVLSKPMACWSSVISQTRLPFSSSGTLSSMSQAFVPSRGEYLNVKRPVKAQFSDEIDRQSVVCS